MVGMSLPPPPINACDNGGLDLVVVDTGVCGGFRGWEEDGLGDWSTKGMRGGRVIFLWLLVGLVGVVVGGAAPRRGVVGAVAPPRDQPCCGCGASGWSGSPRASCSSRAANDKAKAMDFLEVT